MSFTHMGLAGCGGALLMFAADLILYLPARRGLRTASHYFSFIDPHGELLHRSSMKDVSDFRLQLGGALGPIAAVLYAIGYAQLYFGLAPSEGVVAPAVAAIGLSAMMIVGGVYHAIFAHTGFIAKAFEHAAGSAKDGGTERAAAEAVPEALRRLLARHQAYLLYIYSWAAAPALAGSAAVVYCCLTRQTAYPAQLCLVVPALSAPLKKALRRRGAGGLVLCGGLTNLWNLGFFVAATATGRWET